MKLLVKELTTVISQTVTTGQKPQFVEAIRPHLYRHNMPAGSLQLIVLNSTSTQVGASEVIQISQLDPGANFAHGYYRFLTSVGLKANSTYTIQLVATGYSFSESAYIGWCSGYDLGKYQPTTTPSELSAYPLDFEIWHQKNIF